MARDAIPFASRLVRGALVQLIEDTIAFIPNVVQFQYNPEKITRSLTPHDPLQGGGRTRQAPDSQPFNPEEKFTFTLKLSAMEGLSYANPVTIATGVASRLAALRKMVKPTNGLLGDVVGSAIALKDKKHSLLERKTVPITFLAYGPGIILPVRITSFSVDEVLHSPLLYPIEANVALSMTVITPDQYKCTETKFKDLAVAAYNITQLHDDALALANLANGVEDIVSIFI